MDEKQRNRILLLLFVGVLMGALDIAIIGPAFPAIQEEFGVSSRQLAWISNLYILTSLIGTPLMAKLSDRFGRRIIYMIGALLFGTGSLIVASASSYDMLLIGRAVQASGGGAILPVAAAVIGDTFPPEKRGSALGLIGAVFGMAFLVGPLVAILILKFGTWHWLFLINLPIAVGLIIGAMRLLPAIRPANPKPFDFPGMLLLAVILGSLALGITGLDQNEPWLGMLHPRIGGLIMLSLVLMPLFWRMEKSAGDPVLQTRMFQSRQMNIAGLIAVCTGVSETSGIFLPTFAVASFNMEPYEATLWLLPTVVALIIGSPVAGRLLDRVGSKLVIQGGLLLTALGYFVFALLGTDIVWFVVAQVLSGFGLSSLLGAPLRYVVLSEAGEAQRAAAQGLLSVVLSIGQITGTAYVGAVAASHAGTPGGFQQAFLAIGLLLVGALLLSGALKNRAAEQAATAAASS